jgi:hypothetical protein
MKLSFAVAGATVGMSVAGQAARGAAVLTDTFATSTLNAASPGAPTATSTNYAILSGKDATASSIGAGSLHLTMPTTSSGLNEIQALFASTPLTLASAGDFVQFTAVFATTNINAVAGNSTVNIGLYNSHGTTPVTGGAFTNAGLVDVAGPAGFAVGWEGYVARFGVTGNNFTVSRPAQGDTTTESQDLLFNGAATGAFDNPTGVATSSNTSTNANALADGTYTLTFKLTRDAANGLTVENHLYSGVGTGGAELQSRIGTAAAPLTLSFDGLAIGYRETNNLTGNAMDFSLIQVDTNMPIPEPTGLALLGLGAVGILARRRRAN